MEKCIEDYNFNITYDFYENCIYIKPLNDKFDQIFVNILDQNKNSIYSQNINAHKDLTYWFKLSRPFTDFDHIYIEIFDNENLIKTENLKIKTKNGIIIKPVILRIINKVGLGDQMFLSPIIRKLYEIYGQKIIISSYRENHGKYVSDIGWGQHLYQSYQEFLKNNPYVNYFVYADDIEDIKYDIFDVYKEDYIWINQKKLLSVPFNFLLKDEELYIDYVPDKYTLIENLPEKYVCINPYTADEIRSWEKEKWQELVNLLNNSGIYVVSIGKTNYHNLNMKLGIDLAGQTNSISQTWHIIDKSDMFVTFDCSMFVLSETTKTHILQLGWSHDHTLHIPSNKKDKYSYVLGNCDLACANNMNYILEKFGTIKKDFQLTDCFLDINYDCKPSSLKVFKEIMNILSS